jgi:hypothetical protein
LKFAVVFVVVVMILLEPIVIGRQVRGEGKNPFSLPSGVYPLSRTPAVGKTSPRKESKSSEPPRLSQRVNAILITDHVRLAFIDQQIVTVGDTIHDEKVMEIRKDRVVLQRGNKTRALLLSQSPIQLKVEEK